MGLKTDRIMIWKFHDAPDKFRKMHRAAEPATWVAFIPRQIHGADVDEAIESRLGSDWASRYETDGGDVFYCGSCAGQLADLLADGFSNSRDRRSFR